MLDSFQIERQLKLHGFHECDERTHAIGFCHPKKPDIVVYLKDGRAKKLDPRKSVAKQPFVLHPDTNTDPAFRATQAFTAGVNAKYMNSNMTRFPSNGEKSRFGVAVNIADDAVMAELLSAIGIK